MNKNEILQAVREELVESNRILNISDGLVDSDYAFLGVVSAACKRIKEPPPSTGKEVTAVQELIEIVEMDYNNGVEISMKVFHKMLTKALVIEKQQITEAFTSGQANIADIFFDEDGLNYFNNTYDAK